MLNRELTKKGFKVFVCDPYFDDHELISFDLKPFNASSAKEIDLIIVHSFHEEFSRLDFSQFENLSAIFDGRNSLEKAKLPQSVKYSSITIR